MRHPIPDVSFLAFLVRVLKPQRMKAHVMEAHGGLISCTLRRLRAFYTWLIGLFSAKATKCSTHLHTNRHLSLIPHISHLSWQVDDDNRHLSYCYTFFFVYIVPEVLHFSAHQLFLSKWLRKNKHFTIINTPTQRPKLRTRPLQSPNSPRMMRLKKTTHFNHLCLTINLLIITMVVAIVTSMEPMTSDFIQTIFTALHHHPLLPHTTITMISKSAPLARESGQLSRDWWL